MDEDQVMDVGMEHPEPEAQEVDTVPEAPEPPEDEDIDLEDLPLFGGDDEDQEDEPDVEEPPEDAPEEGQEPPEDAPQVVDVGGQQVPVQELVQAATFGRQAAQEVVELREQLAVLDEFARAAGMGRDEYMMMLRQHVEDARLQREADSMGVTPEAARQMLEARKQQQAAQEAIQRQQQAQLAEQQARVAPYMELIQRYPELSDPAKMPPEVMRQIQRGTHPVIAYQDFMLRQRQAAEQVQEQRRAVKERSPGSAAGVGDGQVDDALAAFMAELDN